MTYEPSARLVAANAALVAHRQRREKEKPAVTGGEGEHDGRPAIPAREEGAPGGNSVRSDTHSTRPPKSALISRTKPETKR